MRWAPDARGRLERAAFELFAEQGYAATTVPQITERAGLTTRTFFRHFADKREVVFAGDDIPAMVARMIAEAPPELSAMEAVRHVLHRVATERFDGTHDETAAWRRIIESEDALRDRDARKRADMVRAATEAFIDRGEAPLRAQIAAEVGVLAFHVALEAWVTDPVPSSMGEFVDEVLATLSATVSDLARR